MRTAELAGFLTPTRPMSDEQILIRSAQRGDLEAFNCLVLSYQQHVYNVAYRIMGDEAAASDATQETFISAYRHVGSFHEGSFRNWLLRIARNACYDELRRRKRRPTVSLDQAIVTVEGVIEFDLPASLDGPEQAVQRRELADLLQRGIKLLPLEQRLTLVLRDVQGLRYDEIAEITRSKNGTVKSRLSRARANLREYVQMHREAVWST